jgi:hypothetical protein
MGDRGGSRQIMQEIAASLAGDRSNGSVPHTARRKMSTLVKACGRSKASQPLRDELAAAAKSAGLYTNIPLDDPTLASSEYVRFARTDFPVPQLSPPSEDSLRKWTLSMVGRRGPFARCYAPKVEYPLPNKRRIDLLLRERGKAGRFEGFVVVEFKNAKAKGVVAQTLEYMDLLADTPLAHGKSVRGVIVSGRVYEREGAMLKRLDRAELEWYVLDAKLTRVH